MNTSNYSFIQSFVEVLSCFLRIEAGLSLRAGLPKPRIEVWPAGQQADALQTELRHTLEILRNFIILHIYGVQYYISTEHVYSR